MLPQKVKAAAAEIVNLFDGWMLSSGKRVNCYNGIKAFHVFDYFSGTLTLREN